MALQIRFFMSPDDEREILRRLAPLQLELAPGKPGLEVNDLDDEDQPVKIHARGHALGYARHDGEGLGVPAGPTATAAAA